MSDVSVPYGYVLYVDEAGDDGTRSFRPEDSKGSSEWLCIAGYLVRHEVDATLPGLLASIRRDIGSTQASSLHYRDLSPKRRERTCQLLAAAPARAFAVCSYKRTMQGHSNPRAAARSGGTKQYLYNWIVRILLERVTDFCWRDCQARSEAPRPIKIVFSHRGGHRYGQMKAYFAVLKNQAIANSTFLARRQIRPEMINWHLIDSVPHFQLAGLQFADIVASSAYQSCDTTSPNWSSAPTINLAPILAREPGPDGVSHIRDYGFTLLPSPFKAGLNDQQKTIFEALGYSFPKKI